ncbi:hypothetical protein BpHYR1_046547 [Brachionus plicatilis]|uniref:Uncharacterized protein n=1 Tax=Brachionus plicatilis TaxID=10195 RepID=A0A3M7RES5_BRAPC|nr:hypothetical protein BpHYR1_046547 [Brachionus plicatilis]
MSKIDSFYMNAAKSFQNFAFKINLNITTREGLVMIYLPIEKKIKIEILNFIIRCPRSKKKFRYLT